MSLTALFALVVSIGCAQTAIITYDATSLTTGTAVGQTWTPTGTGVAAGNSTKFSSGTVIDSDTGSYFSQVISGGNSSDDITDIPGAFSAVDFTYEFWIRPADLTGVHNIFEIGGFTTGTAMTMSDANLQFTIRASGLEVDTVTHTLGSVPNDFIQVVGVVDVTNDIMSLYVDGTLVDSSSVLISSTIGGNSGGFGGTPGNIARPDGGWNPTAYDGQLALARFYDAALTETQISNLYTAVVPEPGTVALLYGVFVFTAVVLRRR